MANNVSDAKTTAGEEAFARAADAMVGRIIR